MDPKRLYLVDGSTYIFRAFFAIRSLSSPDGLPTNAVYGFTAMLLKLIRQEKPDALAVVFDKSGRSFRNDLYAPYKAHRPPAPPDLVPQFPLVRDVTRAFNIPALELEGFEADDIIATLATRAQKAGFETVIVSTDKDLMQLVGPGVAMLDTMKDILYDPAAVEAKMGVRPEQIVDFLALLGDSVDNIPGVPGIGKKTAADLLGAYDSLDGIYENIGALKGKRRENLETFKDQAYLAQKLATVACDVPLDIGIDAMGVREPDRAALTEIFGRLGFKTWHREFHESDAVDAEPRLSRDGFALVRTEAELAALTAALRAAPLIAFDTETTGLDPRRSDLVGLSFATDERRAWYVPVRHQLAGDESADEASAHLSPDTVLAALDPILADPARPKAAHNAKFDIQVLRHAGVTVRGLAFDTMLASYLLDPGRYAHSLDNVALDRLNHKTTKFADVAGTGKSQVTFDFVPLQTARDYACEDAQVVMALHSLFTPELEAAGLTGLLKDLELPLCEVLADMEDTGVRIDSAQLEALSAELGARADRLEADAQVLAGESFSLGSPKQIGHILFEVLGLPASKKTKTGWSTDSSVLEDLATSHALPAQILEWRQVTKLKSTYTDVLPTLVNPDTGRIHTSYNQAVAATGRLSSTDPNLQNIPVRTEDGQRIREAFIAEPGRVLLSADYSQIELRVLAHMAGETAMQRAFQEGADIHARTAHELFGTPEIEVTREERSVAKTINFGILYGMSAFRLAREQNLSRSEAQAIIDRYFSRYPRIQQWKDQTLEAAQKDGQVSTLLGRIRRIPDIASKNVMARRGAERVAINTPIQGTAADIIKLAMVRIHRELPQAVPDALMVMQVHDELVFEVPEASAQKLSDFVTRVMGGVVQLDVPLVVNAAWGTSWLEAH
ncbi:MAG: DNA polymerase I [Myxococcota bacterium]